MIRFIYATDNQINDDLVCILRSLSVRYQITSKLMALFQREYPQADQRRRLPCTDFRPCLLANTLIDCGTGLRPADFCKVLRSCGCFVLRVSARAVNAGRKPTSFDLRIRFTRSRIGAPDSARALRTRFLASVTKRPLRREGPGPDAGCSGYSKIQGAGFKPAPTASEAAPSSPSQFPSSDGRGERARLGR